MTTVLMIACVLAAEALVDWLGARPTTWARRGAWPLTILALGLIGYLDATYLAGPLHFGRHGGAAPYWLFVVGVAVLLTVGFLAVANMLSVQSRGRRPAHALLAALGSIIVLHVVDLVTGAHLEWNTVFGYSPTIGIRFVGEGNITFAQLAAAAVLFAGHFVWQVPTRVGTRVALGVLAVTILVMGVPGWGNDFGGRSPPPGFAPGGCCSVTRSVAHGGLSAAWRRPGVLVGRARLLRPVATSARTWASSSRRRHRLQATLVLRRKASENLSVLAHSLLSAAHRARCSVAVYLWFVPRSLRTLVGASTPRAPRWRWLSSRCSASRSTTRASPSRDDGRGVRSAVVILLAGLRVVFTGPPNLPSRP